MLYHTLTPTDVTEKSGFLDQSINSQCSVLTKIPERETQNQFSCRGDVTFSRAFTAQVKVKHESSARPKTTRGLFNQTDFCIFRPTLKIKLNKIFSQNLEIPGSCYNDIVLEIFIYRIFHFVDKLSKKCFFSRFKKPNFNQY